MRLILALLFAVTFAVPTSAKARYFVWHDADFGLKASFPDTWKQQAGLAADGRLQVLAPGGEGAHCTVFARQDKRFTIYPRDYLAEIVAQEIQWEYWEQVVSGYDELYFYYDNYGSLGAGDARYTLVDYIDYNVGDGIRKRAQIHAGIHGDLHMMAMCVAPLDSFDRYAADFGQIIDSVQSTRKFTTNARGYYRDFMETKEYNHHWHERIVTLFFPRKTMSAYVNCSRTKDMTACLYKPKPLPIQTR